MELAIDKIESLLTSNYVLSKNTFPFLAIQFPGVDNPSRWAIIQEN